MAHHTTLDEITIGLFFMSVILLFMAYIISNSIDKKNSKTVSTWNYRVATRLYDGLGEKEREYVIISVYYTNGVANSHGDVLTLDGFCSVDSLRNTYELLEDAFKSNVIDLDNFPNEFKN